MERQDGSFCCGYRIGRFAECIRIGFSIGTAQPGIGMKHKGVRKATTAVQEVPAERC